MLRYFIRLSGRRHFSAFSSHTTGVVNTPTIKVCIIDGKRRTSFAALDDHYRRSILPPPPGLSILPNVFGFLADHTNGSAYPMGCVSVCSVGVWWPNAQTGRVVSFGIRVTTENHCFAWLLDNSRMPSATLRG